MGRKSSSMASDIVPDWPIVWPLFFITLFKGLSCLLCFIETTFVASFLSLCFSGVYLPSFSSAESAVAVFLNFDPFKLSICVSETILSIIAMFKSLSPI